MSAAIRTPGREGIRRGQSLALAKLCRRLGVDVPAMDIWLSACPVSRAGLLRLAIARFALWAMARERRDLRPCERMVELWARSRGRYRPLPVREEALRQGRAVLAFFAWASVRSQALRRPARPLLKPALRPGSREGERAFARLRLQEAQRRASRLAGPACADWRVYALTPDRELQELLADIDEADRDGLRRLLPGPAAWLFADRAALPMPHAAGSRRHAGAAPRKEGRDATPAAATGASSGTGPSGAAPEAAGTGHDSASVPPVAENARETEGSGLAACTDKGMDEPNTEGAGRAGVLACRPQGAHNASPLRARSGGLCAARLRLRRGR